MQTINKTIQFGEFVEGYTIPVLNEREIRAAAGVLFLLMLISILIVVFTGDFTMLKYAVTIFLTDIMIRVLINPKFSPFLILGRLMVRNQVPEYVGAPQKKFAWKIGLILSATIFILSNVINSYGPVTALICLICLVFLFWETAFGICLGCKFYSIFYKDKVQYCPGEVCERKDRQNIQKTSRIQLMIVLGFIFYIVIMVMLLQDVYTEDPRDLWDIIQGTAEK
ncbi:DUF4395 domain-containing protein [Aquimarina sp. D1M17]|uniref:DUF4395 domain-containing protein n=1 Tax=Aquimarina acroporae TaxID=2937283 RepID=UPI0020C049ED|nr:DUF4395 domain-containing protein [Aquimarina acroporae]MCK8522030.1 DUF4395 domain-containing protein [Aquimarina acroporae]